MDKMECILNVSLEDLIRECSLRKRPAEDIYMDFSYTNRENIHQIFKYRKFNYDFSDTISCFNDGEHVLGYLRPSYEDFLSHILLFLGVPAGPDDEELTARMLDRIEELKAIETEKELRMKFPYLYMDLIQGRSFIQSVERMPRRNEEEQKRYETQRHYYYSCALKQRLDRFIETQATLYERFATQRREFKTLIEGKNYNRYVRENFDLNKVMLFMVHQYILECERSNDEAHIKKYLAFIENYEKSAYDKSVAIEKKGGVILTWPVLKVRVDEIRARLKEHYALSEWELVPAGHEEKVYQESGKHYRKTLLDPEEYERLVAEGRRKDAFYEKTHYLIKIKDKFQGYIAYIYPNGEVLLDKRFKEKTPRSAKGDAIYHLNVKNFEALSQMDKGYLRHHPKVGRIYHSAHWEAKALKIIEQEGTEEMKHQAQELVKRFRIV